MTEITWLHLTDFHQGMDSQKWLWPTVRTAFYNDLKRVLKKLGSLDLVFFTGDLTQRAAPEEFARFNEMLADVWAFFKGLGHTPLLVPVPGNHDLERPNSPYAKLLRLTWHTESATQKDFWDNAESEYKKVVAGAFKPYTDWLKALSPSLLLSRTEGIIPGDFSSIFEKEGIRLGIIGLNSAFLQLDDFDYEEKLDLNVRQIQCVCANDTDKWCAKQHINVLLSHHPAKWLEPSRRSHFRMDIAPPGRFAVHLCGHLHSPLVESLAEGGATPRHLVQGRSLFGLEFYRDSTNGSEILREHGYSAGRFRIKTSECQIHLWPRHNVKGYAGELRIAPDVRFNLDEDDAIELPAVSIDGVASQETGSIGGSPSGPEVTLSIQSTSTPLPSRENLLEAPPTPSSAAGHLQLVPRWRLRQAPQHASIRFIEQESFKSGLIQHRAVWLVADWGLGKDGFLYSTLLATDSQKDIYRLDCEGVTSIEQLTSEAAKQWGMAFQDFCVNASTSAHSVLILDNLSEEKNINATATWDQRLDEIVQAALDIAPNLKVILVRRIIPGPSRFPVTQLRPLDEPDCARYISNHSDGGPSLVVPRTLEKLYAKSEGIPMHLDRMLAQLQTVSLEDLPDNASEDDVSDKREPVPRALIQAVASLRDSTNKYTRRSLRLLKILTILSHGEIFQNLKRFDPIDPFFPDNVQQLRDLALIETIPVVSIGADAANHRHLTSTDPSAPKLLLVPRPVRDYIQSHIGEDERRAIVDGAMEVYFGSRWREGKPTLQPLTRIIVWENGTSGLGNHHTIIVSAVRDCLARHNEQLFKRVFRIAEAYLEALRSADKFRDLQQASEELFRILDTSGKRREAARVSAYHGHGLRMIGRPEEAVRALEVALSYAADCGGAEFTKEWYGTLYLRLALTHQSNKDFPSAVKAASEAMSRTAPSSGTYSQAKSIIVQCNIEDKPRELVIKELSTLEAESRRREHVITANGIALEIASLLESTSDKRYWLNRVIESKDDRYSQIRATIRKAKILIASGEEKQLGAAERRIISAAYSYLYSQRFGSLFDDCHDVLWRLNSSDGRKGFLLRLFRFSSFLWRIFGRHQEETEYLSLLSELIPVSAGMDEAFEEKSSFSYYAARLKTLDSPKSKVSLREDVEN